jgi:nucleoside-diphosphate-sugar epimerase
VRVAVVGTGSAVGAVVVPWLHRSGHEVVDLGPPQLWGEGERLVDALAGCGAVLHLAGAPARLDPRPLRGRRPGAHRADVVRRIVRSAEVAGVRRVVATSSSLLYADQGADWITEGSSVCVTSATEPASDCEHAVQRFAGAPCRSGVVLRLGLLLGDSSLTRWSVRAAERGRPVALGDPEGYMHVVHSDDVGPAVEAALGAPSGTYNVGAEPVRRQDLLAVLADAAGRARCRLLGPWGRRWAGPGAEPLGRSLRVSSAAFRTELGWSPEHDDLDLAWFEPALDGTRLGVR